MFKKLFISILILTALSSEGIINFPVNIYNFYMNSGIGSDLLVEKDEVSGQLQPVKIRDAFTESVFLGPAFKLTLNSIKKFQSKNLYLAVNQVNVFYYECTSIKYISISILETLQDVLQKSDKSPPYYAA